MAWYKVAWIDPFFAALNRRFPNRNKSTDGTIGDQDHATGTSGHNPDDTPGVQAERQDADTKPEVRAADASANLGDPRLTMQDVVDAILRTPTDRDRLIYIIFNGFIWRKAGGWRRETYTGADKHRTHIHASGDPMSDEDGAPWTSILTLGDDMSAQAESILAALASGGLNYVDNTGRTQQFVPTVEIYRQLEFRKGVTLALAAIAEKVDLDPAELDLVKAAAREGALSAAEGLAAAVVAALPEGERVTKADVEQAIRSVLGGLDGATPA
jgi:hypothetical protein